MTDQLTFMNPAERFADMQPEPQTQPLPGLDTELRPSADLGEHSYRGTGRLEGRKALITGGDSGIGAATAIAFAKEGADVALAYLPEEQADADHVSTVVVEAGRKAVQIPGDLRDRHYCTALAKGAYEALGGLDILINNAGHQVWSESVADISDEQWDRTMTTNVTAMFWLTKDALPLLEPGSCIINTTSVQAYNPSKLILDYAVSKAAMYNFTKGLAMQLAPQGIRVNAVAPGPVWTPLQVSHGQPPEDLEDFGSNTALGRAGQPTEIAPAFVYLASPESSFVVGETLNVNGGRLVP